MSCVFKLLGNLDISFLEQANEGDEYGSLYTRKPKAGAGGNSSIPVVPATASVNSGSQP